MEKIRIGVYTVDYKGSEVGYLRGELDGWDGRLELRTPILGRYNSYTHAVLCNLDHYSNIPGSWDLTLVDEYEEYTL